MDPLSLAASITGLIAVAGQVCKLLSGFIFSVADAPNSARRAISSTEEMRVALTSIKTIIDRLSATPSSRREMIPLTYLLVTFRESICTLSELEALITIGVKGRLEWCAQEERITPCLQRMESHKTSLCVMMSILQCESDLEAQRSLHSLQDTMQTLVEQNQALMLRLEQYERSYLNLPDTASTRFLADTADDNSTIVQDRVSGDVSGFHFPWSEPELVPSDPGSFNLRREFEVTLESTRVYRRVQFQDCDASFTSSAVRSNAWSMLSGLSLNAISAVSVIALPISLEEIDNIGPGLTFVKAMSEAAVVGNPDSHSPGVSVLTPGTRMRRVEDPNWSSFVKGVRSRLLNPGASRGKIQKVAPRALDVRRARITMLSGNSGDGKTAILKRLIENYFFDEYDPTIEDYYTHTIEVDENRPCTLEILDTQAMEEYQHFRPGWIKYGEAFILVYSITSLNSFHYAREIYEEIVNGTKDRPQRGPVILVGNKCDREIEREVSKDMGWEMANEIGAMFFETSCKTPLNVENAFQAAVRALRREEGYAHFAKDSNSRKNKRSGLPIDW